MKSFRTLSMLLCLTAISAAMANPISEKQAISIVSNFMASKSIPSTGLRITQKAPRLNATTGSDKAAYYVFNANRGFVIIAGDDKAPAVLGYSDKGTFDPQNVPEAMQSLLEGYAAQIEALDKGANAAPRFTSSGTAISPLMSSEWSQKSPYNMLLPILNNNRCVTGCVATALAQVMYYWKWPVAPTTPIPAYTTKTNAIYMPELPVIDFNWDAMQDTYLTSDTTSAAALAAATLNKYCAQAIEMDFLESTSGATTTRSTWVLSNYFGYKASIRNLARGNYSTQKWNDLIYNELAARRPVIYHGQKRSGGHAFVCDGYDGNGMFHINWGWNGLSNGYFLLNVINPDAQSTGSASGAYGYVLDQGAIVGIEPGEGNNEFALTANELYTGSTTTTRTNTNNSFKVTVSGRFCNYTSQTMAVSFGWGLYQGETLKSVLYETYTTSVSPGFNLNLSSRVLNFGSGITSGTYLIKPIYSEYLAENWRPCIGADQNYIEVTINNNNCTLTGHGTMGNRNYTVNSITCEGTLHHGRPVDINVNMTNNGESQNDLLYLHVNGTFSACGYVSIDKGETDVIPFRFTPATAGDYTLSFSFNENGSSPIATRTITITQMPTATLTATAEILNVTDEANKIITSDKYSVKLTITNTGTTTYSDDITAKLYKNIYGGTGSNVQTKNQFLELAPGATAVLQFDMENVSNGWRYFVSTNYYSAGAQTSLKKTSNYTIVFPEVPTIPGDLNNDGILDVTDVTIIISYALNGTDNPDADLNNDHAIDVTDVTTLIAMVLMQ